MTSPLSSHCFRMVFLVLAITACMALVSAEDETIRMPMTGWPCWRGPFGSGSAVDHAGALVDKVEDARLAWRGEDIISPAYQKRQLVSGCGSPAMWNGRVYLYYHSFSEDRVEFSRFLYRGKQPFTDAASRREAAKQATSAEHYYLSKPPYRTLGAPRPWTVDFMEQLLFNLHRDDVLLCLDGETGKTLWRACFPSYHMGHGGRSHNNPCIAGGRVFFTNLDSLSVFCLDAMTGELLWRHDSERIALLDVIRREAVAAKRFSCPKVGQVAHTAVIDGYVVCPLGTFDARTGRYIRPGCLTPARWLHAGKEYLIDLSTRSCFDVQSGDKLWQIGGRSHPVGAAIEGDLLVDASADGFFFGYRLKPDRVERLWQVPINTRTSPSPLIHKGYAYAVCRRPKHEAGGARVLLYVVDLATGTLFTTHSCYHNPLAPASSTNSPVASNGWLVSCSREGDFNMSQPAKAGQNLRQTSAVLPIAHYPGPSAMIVDGRLIARSNARLYCLDLRKNPPAATEALKADPAAANWPEALRPLGSAYRSVRRAAIQQISDSRLFPALVEVLVQGNHTSQAAAARAFLQLGIAAKSVAPSLATLLRDACGNSSLGRLELLVHALHAVDPDTAVVTLQSLLRAGDAPRVGLADVLHAVSGRPALAQALLPELQNLLDHKEHAVLDAVCSCLAAVPPKTAVAVTEDLLRVLRQRRGNLPVHGLRAFANLVNAVDEPAVLRACLAFCQNVLKDGPLKKHLLAQLEGA